MPLSGLIVLFQSPDHFDKIKKIIDEPPHPPGSDGSGAAHVDFDPPKETGQGWTLQQEIKRIDTALRTNDRTVLAEYGGFNAVMRKGRGNSRVSRRGLDWRSTRRDGPPVLPLQTG